MPDFRIKMDVLPGRYTETWFEATHLPIESGDRFVDEPINDLGVERCVDLVRCQREESLRIQGEVSQPS